jgi:hypothetical protein
MSRPVAVRELRALRLISVSSVSDDLEDRGAIEVVIFRLVREVVDKTRVSGKRV